MAISVGINGILGRWCIFPLHASFAIFTSSKEGRIRFTMSFVPLHKPSDGEMFRSNITIWPIKDEYSIK